MGSTQPSGWVFNQRSADLQNPNSRVLSQMATAKKSSFTPTRRASTGIFANDPDDELLMDCPPPIKEEEENIQVKCLFYPRHMKVRPFSLHLLKKQGSYFFTMIFESMTIDKYV